MYVITLSGQQGVKSFPPGHWNLILKLGDLRKPGFVQWNLWVTLDYPLTCLLIITSDFYLFELPKHFVPPSLHCTPPLSLSLPNCRCSPIVLRTHHGALYSQHPVVPKQCRTNSVHGSWLLQAACTVNICLSHCLSLRLQQGQVLDMHCSVVTNWGQTIFSQEDCKFCMYRELFID